MSEVKSIISEVRPGMVVFLRHAESLGNINPTARIQNPGLSDRGMEQIQTIPEGEFDLILVSPMKRALETLKHSRLKGKVVCMTELVREKKCNVSDLLDHEVWPLDWTGEEPDHLVWDRVKKFDEVLKGCKHLFPRILVITHACFAAYYFCHMGQREVRNLQNAEMRIVYS